MRTDRRVVYVKPCSRVRVHLLNIALSQSRSSDTGHFTLLYLKHRAPDLMRDHFRTVVTA
jgi:hypothetical protein